MIRIVAALLLAAAAALPAMAQTTNTTAITRPRFSPLHAPADQAQGMATPAAVAPAVALNRTGWTITADSAETMAASNAARRAIDGNTSTFWLTRYSGGGVVDPLPHSLLIDMKASAAVSALTYLPRQDDPDGRIGEFSLQLSIDGKDWDEVAYGTLAMMLASRRCNLSALRRGTCA